MSSERTPVSGGDENKGKEDGVSQPEGGGHGGGGESGGGGYDRNQGGNASSGEGFGGFMGHGGQSRVDYHGSGSAGDQGEDAPNAAAESEDSDRSEGGPKPGPTAPQIDRVAEQTRTGTVAGGNTVTIMEESGTAAAEAAGTTGVEGQHRTAENPPGSG